MDPYLHTFLAVTLMFVTYTVGRIMGTQKGITSTVSFLLHMGVCTEEDIQKANEKFEQDNF
jgi:hypothetical protein